MNTWVVWKFAECQIATLAYILYYNLSMNSMSIVNIALTQGKEKIKSEVTCTIYVP